ncbi:hypothetical protein QTP88_016118 [Uroleucon formosanum]
MYPYTQRVDTSCPRAAVLSRGKRTRVHGNMGTDLLRDADRQEDDGGYASLAGGGGYIPRRRQRQMFYARGLRLNSDLLAARAQLKSDMAGNPFGQMAYRDRDVRELRRRWPGVGQGRPGWARFFRDIERYIITQ